MSSCHCRFPAFRFKEVVKNFRRRRLQHTRRSTGSQFRIADPAMEWALDKNSDVHGSSYWRILDERYERGSAFHGDDDNYQDASEARGWNQSRKSYRDE
ncbi:hypothetical protein LINPERPRIM_LOCUS37110 [Linum perenne]